MTNSPLDQSGYFSALFKYSRVNACIQMDTEGVIQCINLAFKTYFGYTDEDVADRHFSMLFTPEDQRKGKPATEIKTVLASGQADDKNFMVHKNGSISWVSGESVLVQHDTGSLSLLKIIQDIHEQKDVEESLSRAKDVNERILNAIDDFVIVLDKSLKVLKYNPAFARLFSNKEAIPTTDFAAFVIKYDKDGALFSSLKKIISTGQPFNKRVVDIMTSTGEERVFDINCQIIAGEDQEEILLLTGHDITIQKKADLEREDLMGFVAHELRNPLASIMMGNDLLAVMINEGTPAALAELLEKNKKNIQRLNTMVSELYNATRLSGGNFMLDKAPFNFDQMVGEAVATYRVLQPTLIFNLTGATRKTINGDMFRLQQVVSNYLSNAVKYADGHPNIDIRIQTDENTITVAIKDEGTGIAAEQLPYVFDRFFRVEKTSSLEGMGMGLYLCKRILQAHGGKVWAESRDGKGSVFYFSLPVA